MTLKKIAPLTTAILMNDVRLLVVRGKTACVRVCVPGRMRACVRAGGVPQVVVFCVTDGEWCIAIDHAAVRFVRSFAVVLLTATTRLNVRATE